jgi:hypothetical protein
MFTLGLVGTRDLPKGREEVSFQVGGGKEERTYRCRLQVAGWCRWLQMYHCSLKLNSNSNQLLQDLYEDDKW